MADSLYSRMREHGTLTETPQDLPDATFALPSTLNWMNALALLVENLDFQAALVFYRDVQRRNFEERELNSVFEQLLFALNQIAALRGLSEVPNKADVARVGIVTWYYGIYGSGSAMLAASDGSFAHTHAATARQWDRQLVVSNKVMSPFNDRVSSLIKATVTADLAEPRSRGNGSLTTAPATISDAWGCHAEYLSGTAKWETWNIEQRVKNDRKFKSLGADNFRKKAAREIRDDALSNQSICFLHQASRYRGKANYRDAIYLAYGKSVPTLAENFIDHLTEVLIAFSSMAAAYCSVRMGQSRWSEFIDDLEQRRAISLSPSEIWS